MIDGYKESPLGNIPSNWEVDKIGNRTTSFAGGTPKRGVEGYYGGSIPWIKSGEVNNNSIEDSEEHVTELAIKESSAKLIEANSILVALYGATAGKVGVLKVKACSNQAVLAITTKNETLTNKFLYHYLKKCTSELLNLCQGSGQPNLSKGIVDGVYLPLPPLPEQQKIAEILSTVDAKIDVIDQQITETKALKKGLMQRLLTKGIGHTEFKDSALGEIPKSWEVVRSSNVFELIHGYQFRDYDFTENGLPIVKIGQINRNGEIDMNGCSFFSSDRAEEFVDKRIFNGDVLMALTGATLGKSCWVAGLDNPVYQNYRVGKFVPHDENILSKQFLYFLIGSPLALDQILSKVNSGAQGNVGKSDFEKLKITLPPLKEQHKIASILSSVDEKMNVLNEKKTHYEELKQGLMQQLLTGKIRVNGN
jgi:type I restriction enzyme S subunit